MIPKSRHSMCVNIRVDSDMLAELVAESGECSLSKVLNKKVKHALKMLIDETHNSS